MKIPKAYRLKDPVYKTAVELFVSKNIKELDKLLDYYGVTLDDPNPGAEEGQHIRIYPGDSTRNPDANTTVIWLKTKSVPVLVHELSHHVIKTFEDKRIPINDDTSEVFTYYLEYILQQVLDLWKPKRPKH